MQSRPKGRAGSIIPMARRESRPLRSPRQRVGCSALSLSPERALFLFLSFSLVLILSLSLTLTLTLILTLTLALHADSGKNSGTLRGLGGVLSQAGGGLSAARVQAGADGLENAAGGAGQIRLRPLEPIAHNPKQDLKSAAFRQGQNGVQI